MADSIHMLLANFRNDVLTSLAKLEFQIRDLNTMSNLPPLVPISSHNSSLNSSDVTDTVKKHAEDIEKLTRSLDNVYRLLSQQQEEKEQKSSFLEIQPTENTKNVLISTPALQAAVSRANDMETLHLDSDSEDEHEDVVMSGEESEVEYSQVKKAEQAEETKQAEESMDVEEEDQEDQEDQDEVEEEEDENEEQDEEENAIEVEEFTYKGTVYHRDEDGNVYLDGDEIGQWNGKKILFHKS